MKITLFSYNSSHYHSNLAIRALKTALSHSSHNPQTTICEFSLKDKRALVLKKLFDEKADVYGFSSYIWNIRETLDLAASLKKLLPECKIFFGGPEASFRAKELTDTLDFIDCVITGEGEKGVCALAELYPNLPKIIESTPDPDFESRPIHYVSESGVPEDLAPGRFLYYESSRGCPFSCGYCLSGRDCTVRAKSAEKTLADLYEFEKIKGTKRTVKLVDRTFNYDLARAKAIWKGLLDEKYTHCYHFEIQPLILDDEAFDIFSRAPEGKFQLEAGIQSVNPDVLKACNRKANVEKELENLAKLKTIAPVPVHCDLICGLPTEDLSSVINSINTAYYVSNELQIGFLKLLHGAAITENADKYGIIYCSEPPYEVLQTADLSYSEIFELKGVAKICDRIANSERFSRALSFLLGASKNDPEAKTTPYQLFYDIARRVSYDPSGFSQASMYETVLQSGISFCSADEQKAALKNALVSDFLSNERTRIPPLLR